jgi:hypothetical protein
MKNRTPTTGQLAEFGALAGAVQVVGFDIDSWQPLTGLNKCKLEDAITSVSNIWNKIRISTSSTTSTGSSTVRDLLWDLQAIKEKVKQPVLESDLLHLQKQAKI